MYIYVYIIDMLVQKYDMLSRDRMVVARMSLVRNTPPVRFRACRRKQKQKPGPRASGAEQAREQKDEEAREARSICQTRCPLLHLPTLCAQCVYTYMCIYTCIYIYIYTYIYICICPLPAPPPSRKRREITSLESVSQRDA